MLEKNIIFPSILDNKKILIETKGENIYLLREIRIFTQRDIIFKKSEEDIILKKINDYYENDIQVKTQGVANKLLESIIDQSMIANASDVHIEPMSSECVIKIRVDGELNELYRYSLEIHEMLCIVIKNNSNMDMSEKRIPQDGQFTKVINDKNIDFRVSSIPTINGEKLSIRILNKDTIYKNKLDLGFNSESINILSKVCKSKYGIILICGSTGSGKTTTLYSIIEDFRYLNKNIITIENPVEYKIDGISQIEVNEKIGLTFELGLKSILRQDPDVIVIGEIRDYETANIAIKAANTGHIVISTLHANDYISALNRLKDMGINEYMIESSVLCIISQTLIKKICSECKDDVLLKSTCKHCNATGLKGRIGVYSISGIIDTNIKFSFRESIEYLIDNNIITLGECKDILDDDLLKVMHNE